MPFINLFISNPLNLALHWGVSDDIFKKLQSIRNQLLMTDITLCHISVSGKSVILLTKSDMTIAPTVAILSIALLAQFVQGRVAPI